jgi:uncharacterized protein (TIGR03066 family)
MRVTRCCLVVLALVLVGSVVAAPPEKQILGKWETTEPDSKQKITLEFADKNVLKIVVGQITVEARYKFVDDENMELTMTFPDSTMTEKVKIKVEEKELVLTGKDGKPTKFTRAK